MTTREFSRSVALARLSSRPQAHHLIADEAARAALATRFGLQSIGRLEAWLDVGRSRDGAELKGRLVADVVQTCIVSGEPVPAHVEEELALRFEPADDGREELEVESGALDILPTEGESIDLGEAVAQSLALARDPWPRAAPELLEKARRHLTTEAEAEARTEADKKAEDPFAKLRPQ
jgi:uncharacterized metal-binding protein YceD (DUF177 family)